MVATDVASRGIGMIANPPPSFPSPCLFVSLVFFVFLSPHWFVRDLNGALLSMLVCAICSYNLVQGIYFILIRLLGSVGACRTQNALLTVRSHLRHQGSLSRGVACGIS
jgi:hypothetical protein